MLQKFRCAIQQSGEMVAIVDRSGRMEHVNPTFETLTGYSAVEAVGQSLEILQAEDLVDGPYKKDVECGCFRQSVSWNYRRSKKKRAGVCQRGRAHTYAWPARNNHPFHLHRARPERSAPYGVRASAIAKDGCHRQAGCGVAHDFNNLLLIISAYAELMLDSLAEGHALRRNVGEIMTASRRASDLTRQLLAFGRKQVQSLQVIDLNSAVGEIAEMLAPDWRGRSAGISSRPELGSRKSGPGQVEQEIITNFAANARDAMPRGGSLTIENATVLVDEPTCRPIHSY